MKKQLKIICIITIFIIAMLESSVSAFGSSAMCKSLLTAVGLQEKVLYGDTNYIEITDSNMEYDEETDQYNIMVGVTTNNIADGTELNVTQEVYVENNVISTDLLTFNVSGNTVNSNFAEINMTTEGDTSTVKKIRIIVTYVIDATTGESESKYIDFSAHIQPTITINDISLNSTDMPENVVQLITIPVITQDIFDGEILDVKIIQNGQDIDTSKYSVSGNSVMSNAANIVISAGPEMTIGTYLVQVSYDYDSNESMETASAQSEFTIELIEMKSIIIDQPAISLEVGESTIITYSIVPSTFTDDDLKFTSLDETVATITSGGLVTAVGRGQTTLTISSLDDKVQATCQVSVFEPSVEITELTTEPEILKQGEEGTIRVKIATVDLENGKALDLSIQKHSLDVTNYFTIEGNEIQNNEVNLTITPDTTLVESGEYTIVVSFNSKPIDLENLEKQTRSFNVQSNVKITGITVDKEATRMIVEATRQITATITPENAENKKMIWKSNNEDVATVDENGLITAEGIGTAIITVCSDENPEIFKTINVTVQEIVETEEYTIDNDKRIIKYIQENTTASMLMENIRLGADEYSITSKAGKKLESDELIGTETTLAVEGIEYKVVVIGDADGNGDVTITDVSKLKLNIVEIEILTEYAQIAIDMDRNSSITPTDLSKLRKYLIGLE